MLGRRGIKYTPDGKCPTWKINMYCMDHHQQDIYNGIKCVSVNVD